MRAPPLPNSSAALPVQVDHAARGLRVDGRPYVGIGWYLDGMGGVESGLGFATFANMTDYLTHAQAPLGVNQGMIYRMFTYPPERQLAVLDQLAASGFKVMYEVGQQLSDCGDPIQAELRGMPGRPPSLPLSLSLSVSVSLSLSLSHAGDGRPVLQRLVQARVAERCGAFGNPRQALGTPHTYMHTKMVSRCGAGQAPPRAARLLHLR